MESGDALEEVRRAMRWATVEAAGVYTKRHLRVKARERLPPHVVQAGEWLIAHGDQIAYFWIARVLEEQRLRPHSFIRTKGREATVEERRSLLH